MASRSRVIIRNDCYRIENNHLRLPKDLRLKYKGRLKWHGKQGRLEIIYDELDEVWRGFMTVEVERPPKRGGNKSLNHVNAMVKTIVEDAHELGISKMLGRLKGIREDNHKGRKANSMIHNFWSLRQDDQPILRCLDDCHILQLI